MNPWRSWWSRWRRFVCAVIHCAMAGMWIRLCGPQHRRGYQDQGKAQHARRGLHATRTSRNIPKPMWNARWQ